MATLQYRLSTRVSGDLAEVLVRFSGRRGFVQRAKSHVFCPVSAWDEKAGAVIVPRRLSPEVADIVDASAKLDRLRSVVFARWSQEQYDARDGWLQQTIDECFDIGEESLHTIGSVFEEYAEARNLDAATQRQYHVLLEALKRWAGRRTLYVDEIRVADIDAFCAFFRRERVGRKVVSRSQNTITGKLKRWRALMNFAVQRGYIQSSPFAQFRVPAEVYGTPIFLTIEERNRLYAFDGLPEALRVQRDIFIFQCHVGCRVSDLVSLTKANVADGFLQYIPQKQRRRVPITVRVPLSQVAREIVERYADCAGDRLLPFIHPNNYNACIHDFLQRAGIDRVVMTPNKLTMRPEYRPLYEVATSHTARKTFIEAMFRETKSERLTSAFTGHVEGSRAFSRYTDVDDDMKLEIINRLENVNGLSTDVIKP